MSYVVQDVRKLYPAEPAEAEMQDVLERFLNTMAKEGKTPVLVIPSHDRSDQTGGPFIVFDADDADEDEDQHSAV